MNDNGGASRQLAERMGRPLPGTIASLDWYLGETIEDRKPLGVGPARIRREVAVYWLRRDRPVGFWRNFVWACRLLGALFPRR
jgi:hypothetical protein